MHRETEQRQNIELIIWQQQKADCSELQKSNKTCPSFSFIGMTFKNYPELNRLIEKGLLTLITNDQQTSLWDYQRTFLNSAQINDHLYLEANIVQENDVLIVVELTVKESLADSFYVPLKTLFINFDKNKRRPLQLKDIIYSDKLPSFWTVAQGAYNQWLEINQLLNNDVFLADWPFIKTEDMALLSKSLTLKYQANTIAPYAMGNPVLDIPYDKLDGIIRPEYRPH